MNDTVTPENDNARAHIQTHEKLRELTAMIVELQKLYCELAARVTKVEEPPSEEHNSVALLRHDAILLKTLQGLKS